MALFTPDDRSYDESHRMTGFNRYKQLLSFHAASFTKINLITTVAALPLAAGITISLLSSSSLLMAGSSLIGGMILAPFICGLYDSIMRGLMGDPGNWWSNYKKSLKNNAAKSLLPGAVFGLCLGMFIFMLYIMLNTSAKPSPGTLSLFVFSFFLLTLLHTLFWPQFVLFEQDYLSRMRNILLFSAKYLWKLVKSILVQWLFLALFVLFSPLTLLVIPFAGFWYPLLLSQMSIYEELNNELRIEELYKIHHDFDERYIKEEEAAAWKD